jgi:8-oxo-dGTP diphosphatase
LTNSDGAVLINQRTRPARFAGQWEFPGGKVESGETLHSALTRELKEELGVEVIASATLVSITHEYPHATVQLNVRRVTRYEGTPTGAEGQAIRWVQPHMLHEIDFLQANEPIIDAVCRQV